jgi:hypothetical protein
MAQIGGQEPRFEVVSEDARKLFPVKDHLGVATYGQAVIGEQTIGSLMERFQEPADEGVSAYAASLGEHFSALLSGATQPRRGDLLNAEGLRWPLGFVVAGFDGDTGLVYEVKVRAGDHQIEALKLSTDNPGVYSFGQSDGIDRLLAGIDRRAVGEAKIPVAEGDEIKLELLRYEILVPDDLDEAAELAESLVEVQLLAQRFSSGTYASKRKRVPGCGGRIRTLRVTPGGARWVQSSTSPPASPREASPPTGEAPRRAQRSA